MVDDAVGVVGRAQRKQHPVGEAQRVKVRDESGQSPWRAIWRLPVMIGRVMPSCSRSFTIS